MQLNIGGSKNNQSWRHKRPSWKIVDISEPADFVVDLNKGK